MAFPTTSVLDALNSASLSANWTTPTLANPNSAVETVAGMTSSNPSFNAGAYWNPATFGADTECYCTVSAKPASGDIGCYVRITNPGTTTAPTLNCYLLLWANTAGFTLYKCVAGTFTSIQSSLSQTMNIGDSFGLSVVGTTLTTWYKASGGSWVSKGTLTDSAVSGAGSIGIRSNNGIVQGFGGGTVVAAAFGTYTNLPLLGVG